MPQQWNGTPPIWLFPVGARPAANRSTPSGSGYRRMKLARSAPHESHEPRTGVSTIRLTFNWSHKPVAPGIGRSIYGVPRARADEDRRDVGKVCVKFVSMLQFDGAVAGTRICLVWCNAGTEANVTKVQTCSME